VAGAEKVHEATCADCFGADLAGSLDWFGLRLVDLVEDLDARLDPTGA
jgi:hypothetical protein